MPGPKAGALVTAVAQRWSEGRTRFRPAGELIRTAEYDVAPIAADAVAKAFVETHHYSRTFPAARVRVGLYRRGALVGVAVFSHPCSDKVLTSVFPDARSSVELGRFVLLDEVPGNGETWFLARCFELLRAAGFRGVVSFSDPVPRDTADGCRVFLGHIGTIYQAHNARYLGRGTARRLRLLPDGRTLSDRALQKIRDGSRGWRYAAAQLEAFGADAAPADDRGAWLATWLPRLTRAVAHPGNHKYAWALDRRLALPVSLAYPKAVA
ncbi:MAG TPA: hypothetical protein VEA16_19085 [Vicinamibacterales bacterium]|nr:hypothetical protein [Vicinamibacterales bacterium]